MRYWTWSKRLRLKRKTPKVRPAHRKRREHKSARDRLRDFGLSRFRYLWFIPILAILIIVVANVRVPKTVTVVIQSAAQSAQAETVSIQSAKFRTSIPAGYRLAVDVRWRGEGDSQEVMVELLLRDGTGSAVAKGTTAVWTGAADGAVSRAELEVPYNLSGRYDLSVRILGTDGMVYEEETPLGRLTVY